MCVPTLSAPLPRSPIQGRVPSSARVFSVLQGGSFGGRIFLAGEILVVDGSPVSGDEVVMVPRGQGRPQLGCVDGLGLYGSHGEPCSIQRWRVSGQVQAVARTAGSEWAIEWFDAPGIIEVAPQVRGERPQLSLFAA